MCTNAVQADGTIAAGPGDFVPRQIPLHRLDLPAEGDVHVWYLDIGALAMALEGALDGHSRAALPHRFTPGQLRFARRFYLRLLLGAYLGVPGKAVVINRSIRGKPVLDASAHPEPLLFSMAKSGDRLLIGFSTTADVGVDLEPAARKTHRPLALAHRYFSRAEAAALDSLPPGQVDRAFMRAWACKEAVVKASGQGIANQLCRFTIATDMRLAPAVLEFDGEQNPTWSLALLQPEEDFLGAIATPCETLAIRAFRLLPADIRS